MTGHSPQPLDGGAGAHAIKIAAAAQEAVKHLPQFSLGAGDINRIISMTSHGSLSIAERINLAQNIARDTAKAYLDQPGNNSTDMQRHVEQQAFGPRGLGAYDFSRMGPLAWQDGDRGSPGGTRSGVQYTQLNGASGWADVRTTPGTGYSMLSAANQHVAGFSREQVAGAANFLHSSGVNREDINHDTRHMVHLRSHQSDIRELIQRKKEIEWRRKNGEDVGDAEHEHEQARQNVRKKMTPNQQRHFDQMRSINTSNKDLRSELGAEAAREAGDQKLTSSAGEAVPGATTAAITGVATKDAPRSTDDTLAGLLDTAGVTTPARAAAAASPAAPAMATSAVAPAGTPTRDVQNATGGENRPVQSATRTPAGPTMA